jgi:competence protein ComEA
MLTNPLIKPPPVITVLAVVIFLILLLSREASTTEGLPAFLPLECDFVHVELTGDGLESGVYQFYDGLTLGDVTKLTEGLSREILTTDPVWYQPLRGGESFKIIKKDQKIEVLFQGWMKASHRVAMTIPLHPDRMSRTDWNALPGVGDAFAERIEIDRQVNGDYGHLEALVRVKGIGKKRVNSWREFF